MNKPYKHKKKFGQNFLIDQLIIAKIISKISPCVKDIFLEIGPGHGAITSDLLKYCKNLTAIEIDTDLIKHLNNKFKNQNNFNLINIDILKYDFKEFNNIDNLRVVGNLPYNISSQILFRILEKNNIKDCNFMLQKEVADRLAASPNGKTYGRLSVMAQYHCKIEILIDVPNIAFDPAPKVQSSFIKLTPYKKLPFISKNYDFLYKIVNCAFSKRRKTISNSLKQYFTKDDFIKLNIDPLKRAENLSVKDFVNLSNYV